MTQVPGFIGSQWKLPEVLTPAVGMSPAFLLVWLFLAKSLADWDLWEFLVLTEKGPCLGMLSWGPMPWTPVRAFSGPMASLSEHGRERVPPLCG